MESAGFDWLAWVLAAIALAAVIGLVALWVMVYRVYTTVPRIPPTPTAVALPTATVANVGQQTSVPDLVNLNRDEVGQLLAQAGLQLAVKEERFDDKQPVGIALEQSPPSGTPAKRGDVVQVVFSKGPKVNNVPGVIGTSYSDEIKAGLESYGWKVALEPQWSTDPISKVIGQIPAPGIPLTAGQVITLQVSSGSVVPIDANLGNLITLESANLPRDTLRPGEMLELTLRWKARVNNIEQPYKVFVHLMGPTGKLVTQVDREPQDGRSPTTTWVADVVVQDRYSVEIPPDAPRGPYQLRVGMYPANNPVARLPVVDPGKVSADNNSLLVKTLTFGP